MKTYKLVHPNNGIPQHLYPCILAMLEGLEMGVNQTQKAVTFSYREAEPGVLTVSSNSDRLLDACGRALARFRIDLQPVTD